MIYGTLLYDVRSFQSVVDWAGPAACGEAFENRGQQPNLGVRT